MFASRRARVVGLVVGLVAASLAQAAAAESAGRMPFGRRPSGVGRVEVSKDTSPVTDGSVLVRPSSEHAGEFAALVAEQGLVEAGRSVGGFRRVRKAGLSSRVLAERLRRDRRVGQSEPELVRRVSAVPNDPGWADYQAPFLGGLRMTRAWDQSAGTGVVVAVLDTGIDLDHPDLVGSYLAGVDIVNGDNVPQDDNGHGTAVAGIVAARTNNGLGIAGVAPGARILPVKVMNAQGQGTDLDIAAGLRWATDHGADVINLSLGGYGATTILAEAVQYAVARDVLVVAAAGNDGTAIPAYPASFPDVMSVAATDDDGELVLFSNHGPTIDVAAPGVAITTTALVDGPGEGYAFPSGTSFSSPIVAGVAALARSAFPAEAAGSISKRIKDAARDVGPYGIDDAYGAGVVDAFGAAGGPKPAATPSDAPSPREPNDVPARATLLTTSGTVDDVISPEGDQDWFRIDLYDAWWSFSVVPPVRADTDPSGFDPVLEIYDADLDLIATADDAGVDGVEQLRLALKEGTYYGRVRNYLGTRSPGSYHFNYSWADYPPAPPPRFESTAFMYGTQPQGVTTADVTGDGRRDVIATFQTTNISQAPDFKLGVFAQAADGSLDTTGTMYPTSMTAFQGGGVAAGDLDGDGDDDVVVTSLAGVDIYYQHQGSLGGRVVVPVSGYLARIVDMDGDGRKDIVTVESGFIRVLRNLAIGFTPTIIGTTNGRHFDVGDLTGDGRPDIVVVESNGGATLRVQQPGGTFVSQAITGGAQANTMARIDDVSGDGRDDLIFDGTVPTGGLALDVRLQQAGGGLGAPRLVPVSGSTVHDIHVGDMNLDGRADIVHRFNEGISILEQQTDGSFVPGVGGSGANAQHPKVDSMDVADIDGDGDLDIVQGGYFGGITYMRQLPLPVPPPVVPTPMPPPADVTPPDRATDVASTATMTATFVRAVQSGSATDQSVQLRSGRDGALVPSTVSVDGTHVTLTPTQPLAPGPYEVSMSSIRDADGNALAEPSRSRFVVGAIPTGTAPQTTITSAPPSTTTSPNVSTSFTADRPAGFWCHVDTQPWQPCTSPAASVVTPGTHTFAVFAVGPLGHDDATEATAAWTYAPPPPPPPPTTAPPPPPPVTTPLPAPPVPAPARGSGYWMVASDGSVYAFGDAGWFGNAPTATAEDLEPTPSGRGYWVVDAAGNVFGFGDAPYLGGAGALRIFEKVTAISSTPSGAGYWLFTTLGRVLAFGDAAHLGDMSATRLNGPVLDSIPTPSGRGYYMVASDGGIFTFGDADFRGSMGAVRLNAPVQSLVPDGDGRGYWLVASDGGIFAFDAAFYGSMGDTRLNRPITGMVAAGAAGYLMVGEDGGIFTFGSAIFHGSLGDRPPARPITSVAVLA